MAHELDTLDDEALDRLPFGVVKLDARGRVTRYNAAEARRANVQRWRVLGRDFCREMVGRDGERLAARIEQLAPGARVFLRGIFGGYRMARLVTVELQRTTDGGAYLAIHPVVEDQVGGKAGPTTAAAS